MTDVHGYVAAGFESVAQEFQRNFTERQELGAAFAAYLDGDRVVDIWGGTADLRTASPWTASTAQVIFSGSKALAAMCILLLLERGSLHLEDPVARYWPEFAARGKEDIRIRHVVSHTAGLPALRRTLSVNELLDERLIVNLLAMEHPLVAPGGPIAYHAVTFGWLCGEIVYRIDGRTVGQFFADEVATPLGLELWIGIPPEVETRVARLETAIDWGSASQQQEAAKGNEVAALAWNDPPVWDPKVFPWNRPDFHSAELAAVGAIGTARSIARFYGCLARGGEIDGIRILSEKTVEIARTEIARGIDVTVGRETAFGVGFALPTEYASYGPPHNAFGHRGAGGSMHGAWPTLRVGFSYAMNMMIDRDANDARAMALLQALHADLANHEASAAV